MNDIYSNLQISSSASASIFQQSGQARLQGTGNQRSISSIGVSDRRSSQNTGDRGEYGLRVTSRQPTGNSRVVSANAARRGPVAGAGFAVMHQSSVCVWRRMGKFDSTHWPMSHYSRMACIVHPSRGVLRKPPMPSTGGLFAMAHSTALPIEKRVATCTMALSSSGLG